MKCPACGQKKVHGIGCLLAPVDVQARLREIDAWAGTVNDQLAILRSRLDTPEAYPDGAPPGVVSPHVKENLKALGAWCTWEITRLPDGAPGTERILTELHARIMLAMAGGDVAPPPR